MIYVAGRCREPLPSRSKCRVPISCNSTKFMPPLLYWPLSPFDIKDIFVFFILWILHMLLKKLFLLMSILDVKGTKEWGWRMRPTTTNGAFFIMRERNVELLFHSRVAAKMMTWRRDEDRPVYPTIEVSTPKQTVVYTFEEMHKAWKTCGHFGNERRGQSFRICQRVVVLRSLFPLFS